MSWQEQGLIDPEPYAHQPTKPSQRHLGELVEYLNTSLVQLCPRDPEALEARRKGRDAP
ncbi:unnamed protein product [Dovyalis caffra]|uniref:Uncharacterized protein n=1 Tax=Dovyalis caffra TaxID=77055 RepID=A0AAV1QX56_9ROSI|nr:unnamed protein product [Dovyalis caffra]